MIHLGGNRNVYFVNSPSFWTLLLSQIKLIEKVSFLLFELLQTGVAVQWNWGKWYLVQWPRRPHCAVATPCRRPRATAPGRCHCNEDATVTWFDRELNDFEGYDSVQINIGNCTSMAKQWWAPPNFWSFRERCPCPGGRAVSIIANFAHNLVVIHSLH